MIGEPRLLVAGTTEASAPPTHSEVDGEVRIMRTYGQNMRHRRASARGSSDTQVAASVPGNRTEMVAPDTEWELALEAIHKRAEEKSELLEEYCTGTPIRTVKS